MTEKLTEKDLVTFRELVIFNSIMVNTLAQLMIEKGIITEDEFCYVDCQAIFREAPFFLSFDSWRCS